MNNNIMFIFAVLAWTTAALRMNVAPTNECDDMEMAGPDWADEEEHWDDFLTQLQQCREDSSLQLNLDSTASWDNRLEFVHVGKCAGASVRGWFEKNHINFRETQLKEVNTCTNDEKKRWVITVRDPVERAISSFNWRSPKNRGSKHGTQKFGQREHDFYKCFNFFNDFAEALEDESECGNRARNALQDPKKSEHLGKGIAWYMKDQLDCVMAQDFILVHPESMEKDLAEVAKIMKRPDAHMKIPHTHTHYPMKDEKYVSPKAQKNLDKWLAKDYEVLQALETKASSILMKLDGKDR